MHQERLRQRRKPPAVVRADLLWILSPSPPLSAAQRSNAQSKRPVIHALTTSSNSTSQEGSSVSPMSANNSATKLESVNGQSSFLTADASLRMSAAATAARTLWHTSAR